MSNFQVGNLVVRRNGEDFRSGCCADHEAVVISTDPFVLVSEGGDMRWGSVKPEEVCFVGYAKPDLLKACLRRLER